MEKRTVALVNHQPVMLDGLVRAFAGSAFNVVASSVSLSEAEAVIARQKPDVIVMDCPHQEGIAKAVAGILRNGGKTRAIVFSMGGEPGTVIKALEAGAAGFVCSTSEAAEIVAAAEAVARGETFVSAELASKVVSALRLDEGRRQAAQAKRLSVREEQIARLLLDGKTNRQIASELGLSEKTVKHYMSVLMQKLAVKNRLELALAIQAVRQEQGLVRSIN